MLQFFVIFGHVEPDNQRLIQSQLIAGDSFPYSGADVSIVVAELGSTLNEAFDFDSIALAVELVPDTDNFLGD